METANHGYTVTVQEAARQLGLWPQSVRFLIAGGRLRATLAADGKYLIHSADLETYERRKGGKKSDGLRDVKIRPDADREGKYTHSPKLRETIAACGMSIQGFADAMGISVSMFYYVEQGKRNASAEYRAKAAALLDVPESDLFRRQFDPRTP